MKFKSFRKNLICVLILVAGAAGTNAQDVYRVLKAGDKISVDGKLDETDWDRAVPRSLDHFYHAPEPYDKQSTTLRMLYDEHNIYLSFQCEDRYITARETKRDGQPYFDDCAEIFLIPAPAARPVHIGLELNLYYASNDFVFLNDFYQGKNALVKDFDPDFEVKARIDGTLNDNSDTDKGWTMEFAIPIIIFRGLDSFSPVKSGNRWTFLAVRQDRNDAEGNRRSTSTIFPLDPEKTDVHDPEIFGYMEFE